MLHCRCGVLVAVLSVGLASCKGPTKEPMPQTEPEKAAPADAASPKPEIAAQNDLAAYANAVLSLGNLLKAEAISWPDIDAKYEIVKPRLEGFDAKHQTSYATELFKALAGIKAGEMVEVNRHIVTKGLQHVTVWTIEEWLDRLIAEDPESARKTAASIKTVFAAIEPTFQRRDDTVYAGKPTLVPAVESALRQLESAQTKPALANAAMELSAVLSKTYVLSVLYEIKGVEEFCGNKGPDPAQCAIKRTEAGMYYRIIKPKVESRDKETASTIEKMIQSEHAIAEYALARDMLAKTLALTAQELTF